MWASIGLGRIGKAIAKRAEAFGMKVAYSSRNRQPDVAYDYYAKPINLGGRRQDSDRGLPGGKETRNASSAGK